MFPGDPDGGQMKAHERVCMLGRMERPQDLREGRWMSEEEESLREAPEASFRPATGDDVCLILQLIRELAEYEKLSHEVVATEDSLRRSLFGERP